MKIYSNTNRVDTIRIEFELCYNLNPIGVMCTFNPQNTEKAIKDCTEQDFYDFIYNVKRIIKHYGYFELESHKSNRNNSLSCYIAFCKKNEFIQQKVECIFYLRISDHALSQQTAKGQDREIADNTYHDEKTKKYYWLNKETDFIPWNDLSIIVNGEIFERYSDAVKYTNMLFKNL